MFLEQLCTTNIAPNMERLQSIKQTELAMELISEFVFCEVDRKGTKKKVELRYFFLIITDSTQTPLQLYLLVARD